LRAPNRCGLHRYWAKEPARMPALPNLGSPFSPDDLPILFCTGWFCSRSKSVDAIPRYVLLIKRLRMALRDTALPNSTGSLRRKLARIYFCQRHSGAVASSGTMPHAIFVIRVGRRGGRSWWRTGRSKRDSSRN